jgi:primary-amine oxidase
MPLQDRFHEAVVNLTTQTVDYNVRLGPNVHAPYDASEIIEFERIAVEHPDVRKELEKLQLPEGSKVVSDPWIYGTTIFLSMTKSDC